METIIFNEEKKGIKQLLLMFEIIFNYLLVRQSLGIDIRINIFHRFWIQILFKNLWNRECTFGTPPQNCNTIKAGEQSVKHQVDLCKMVNSQ